MISPDSVSVIIWPVLLLQLEHVIDVCMIYI
jgi:hypothetical protein